MFMPIACAFQDPITKEDNWFYPFRRQLLKFFLSASLLVLMVRFSFDEVYEKQILYKCIELPVSKRIKIDTNVYSVKISRSIMMSKRTCHAIYILPTVTLGVLLNDLLLQTNPCLPH